MKEFLIAWATEHWFLTFLLLWMVLGCVQKFFGIFHRNPVVANEEQINQMRETIREELTLQVEVALKGKTAVPPSPTGSQPGKPWHERLEED